MNFEITAEMSGFRRENKMKLKIKKCSKFIDMKCYKRIKYK